MCDDGLLTRRAISGSEKMSTIACSASHEAIEKKGARFGFHSGLRGCGYESYLGDVSRQLSRHKSESGRYKSGASGAN